MYRGTIKKILENQRIDDVELNTFVSQYVKDMTGEEIKGEKILEVAHACKVHLFNLRFAAMMAGIKENMNILEIFNKHGQLVRTIVSF